MKISESTIERIRNLSAIDVIGDRVLLKQKGRHWVGLCPFHNEKTPSFAVNEGKNLYHCFGCEAGGDVIQFIQDIDSLDFREAILSLADRHGIDVEFESSGDTERYREQVSERRQLIDTLEAAQRFFHANWHLGRKYLRSRDIDDDAVQAFGIGYAPNAWNSIAAALPGTSRQTLIDAGLLVERDGVLYDRFRDRVMFPIRDRLGRVVAFGGRTIGDCKPKYLNSPESLVFKKGDLVYNSRHASKYIKEAGEVIVVEGYLDVVALWNVGLKNAVATMGTAFSLSAIAPLLARCNCRRVVLNFDSDDAGKTAADRAVSEMYRHLCAGDLDVKVVTLPGKDVDDYLRGGGVDYPVKIRESPSGLTWMAARLAEGKNLTDPIDLKEVISGSVGILRDIQDDSLRSAYSDKFHDAIAGNDPSLSSKIAALLGHYITRPIVPLPESQVLTAEQKDLSSLRAYLTLVPGDLERVEAELDLYGLSLPEEGGSCFASTTEDKSFVDRTLKVIGDRRCWRRYKELRARFSSGQGTTEEKNAMRKELTGLRDRLFNKETTNG